MLAMFERLSWTQRVTIAALGTSAAAVVVLEGLSAETVPAAVGLVVSGMLALLALFVRNLTVPAAGVSILWTAVSALTDTRLDNTFGIIELAALAWLVVRVVMLQPVRRVLWMVPLLFVAVVILPLRLEPDSNMEYLGIMVAALMLGVAFMVMLGLYLRLHEQRRIDSFEFARQAQRLEYARDLHVFVAPHVSAIVAQAKAVRYTTAAGQPPSAEALDTMLAGIEKAGSQALVSMRGMIGVLRGDEQPPEQRTLGDVLHTAANQFAGPGRVVTSIDDEIETRQLPLHMLDAVQHVVQEALTNILRHAGNVNLIEITAHMQNGELQISVRNDGTTATEPTLPSGGFGLTGLTERVEGVGGHLLAGPANPGWRVTATLPVAALTSSAV